VLSQDRQAVGFLRPAGGRFPRQVVRGGRLADASHPAPDAPSPEVAGHFVLAKFLRSGDQAQAEVRMGLNNKTPPRQLVNDLEEALRGKPDLGGQFSRTNRPVSQPS
jgi:hypothetical protein